MLKQSVKASIITIGDELLIGQVIDTNSAWISSRLDDIGVRVRRRFTVGDDGDEIMCVLDRALSDCGLVVITGGLGPTRDDITKSTLANYFDSPLVEDAATVVHLKELLAARGLAFNALNRGQALVPQCCTVIRNDNGTAPCMWFERGGRVVVSLPGVPFEMKALMEGEVAERLKRHFNLADIVHRTVTIYGLPESELAMTISGWEDSLPAYLKLAYLPGTSGIRLRLSAYDADIVEVRAAIDLKFRELEAIIPGRMLSFGDQSLSQSIGRLLVERGLTLSIAESCTGGAISGQITAVAGASGYFRGGVVAYSNRVKVRLLGVREQTLERHGAVSEQVATEMALGAMERLGSDVSIATTGVAGPGGGTVQKPVGTVWIAVAGPFGVATMLHTFGNLRQQNVERATSAALDMLRRELAGVAEG